MFNKIMIFSVVVLALQSFSSAQAGPFSSLGDKPAVTVEKTVIPQGWEEIKFSPPDIPGRMLYQTDDISIVYHHYQEPVFPATSFKIEGKNTSLMLFATPGEYEPVTFTLRSKKGMKELSVIPTDLKHAADTTGCISADNCEVRVVRMRPRNNDIPFRLGLSNQLPDKKYLHVPILLVKENNITVQPDANYTFWITYFIPEATLPGTYSGGLKLQGEGTEIILPVRLHALPFRLVERPITFQMYYDCLPNEDLMQKELQDMANRGFSSLFGAQLISNIYGTELDTDSEGARLLKTMAETGLDHSLISGSILDEKGLYTRGGYDFGRDADKMAGFLDLNNVMSNMKASGIPRIINPTDEPEFKGRAVIEQTMEKVKKLKKQGMLTYISEVGPCTGLNGGAFYMPYLDIECYNGGGMYPEYSEGARRRGAQYWYYANGAFPSLSRFFWGQQGWALETDGITSWTYRSIGMPADRSYQELSYGYPRLYTYPSDKGYPIPTVAWESLREGMDDFAYLATLENWVSALQNSSNKDLQRAIVQARTFLDTFRYNTLKLNYLYKNIFQDMDSRYYDKMRVLTAAHIMRLLALSEGGGAGSTEIPALDKMSITYGEESLQDNDFAAMKTNSSPWKIEKHGKVLVERISALPGKKGSGISISFPESQEEASVDISQDISKRLKDLKGRTVEVKMEIYSQHELPLGVMPSLPQNDAKGKPIRIGSRPGSGMNYYTATVEPGKWVNRVIPGVISADAESLVLFLSIRALHLTPEESKYPIFMANISMKPVRAGLNVPEAGILECLVGDLSDASFIAKGGKKNKPFPVPVTENPPFPKKNSLSAAPSRKITEEDPPAQVILSDNIPVCAGRKLRTGITGAGAAFLLIDGRHDQAHGVSISAGQSKEFVFDLKNSYTIKQLEARGFEWEEWGYGIVPLSVELCNDTNSLFTAVPGQWHKKVLDEKEPWESSYIFQPEKELKAQQIKISAPATNHPRYLSEIYIYGKPCEDMLAQQSMPREGYSYPADKPIAGEKTKIKVEQVISKPAVPAPYGAEKLIDGSIDMNSRWQLAGSKAVIDFIFSGKQRINGLEMYLGALGWFGKCQPRYIRFFYNQEGKWVEWEPPVIGNLKTFIALKGQEAYTDKFRLELLGSWAPYNNLIREVDFFYLPSK